MKVTILGSGGQIGAYLTEYLRKKDYEVLEFDPKFKSDAVKLQNNKTIENSFFIFRLINN